MIYLKLSEIINNLKIIEKKISPEVQISDLVYDSREVMPGSAFVCLVGAEFDGHNFIEDAIKRGANTIITQKKCDFPGINVILVEDTREALAVMSKNFFKDPSSNLITIGITGTKGKTTTACMIKSILEFSGQKAGMLGTLGAFIGERVIELKNTTPESYDIHKYLRLMVDSGCKYAILEASSIGLRDHRLYGFNFDYGIFTNLSSDHIGGKEHKDMEEYIHCKSKLFKKCNVGFVNYDDANTSKIIDNHTCKIKTFGFSNKSQIWGENIELLSGSDYLGCKFKVHGEINLEVKISVPGKFNAYNALAAISVCNYIGIKDEQIKEGLALAKIKGRLEIIKTSGKYTLIIDYAHNASGMENTLKTLREYKPKRLITMFGGGGNRPKIRRYEMGEISGKFSDLSVITEDNSRNEDVMDIISDIKVGLRKTSGKYIVIPNRKDAIRYCIENAKEGDIIVLAGKGHETYQETKGIKSPFDERQIVNEILSNM